MVFDLGFGLDFQDLYDRDGLARVDQAFLAELAASDAALCERLIAARAEPDALDRKAESALLVDAAPYVEDFLATLFAIGAEVKALQQAHDVLAPLYTVKRLFVQRRAVKGVTQDEAATLDGPALARQLEVRFGEALTEASFAAHVDRWLAAEALHEAALGEAQRYAAWATLAPAGKARHADGVLFKVPHKLDPAHLVPVEPEAGDAVAKLRLPRALWRRREGFGLTDPGMDLTHALDHANYCIWCHNQGKDSCSLGLADRKTGKFQASPFGVTLAGCPLDERISEMNLVKSRGNSLGALAIVTIDNPMAAATGHRICNDCMKSCIYQKQEPVDIPQIETRSLKDVLALPYGFEIYSLLTRWNPLNLRRPLPKPATGYKVLLVGLGPAGFTLAHHLLNDGHAIVAIDGLKIEPLDPALSGVEPDGTIVPFQPIRDVTELWEDLDNRVMAGFGGVAEYGITVRWNKNFLKVIRLLLERRRGFAMMGGVRFGGTITIDSAFQLGFDHVALCAGAGRPTVIPMRNGLATGVRQASDFLMALQLTGAAKTESIANLQVRLPVVVVGGGLTAIDTATESLAYYPVQVEKFLTRFEALAEERGAAAVCAGWSEADREAAEEFLAHARALRVERDAAAAEGRAPRIVELLNEWGGVTIAYRRRLIDAPSYTLNHEEVALALQEGIAFAECLVPEAVEIDQIGQAIGLTLLHQPVGTPVEAAERVTLPARTILIAAGTQPNTVLGREDPGNIVLDGKYFQAYDEAGNPTKPEKSVKPAETRVLMSQRADGRAISFFGDLHPSFAGNVVKAMGSAKRGYPVVSRILSRLTPTAPSPETLIQTLNDGLRATVHAVTRLTPTIVEVTVRAPLAAQEFQPGQFYRLQNYETRSARVGGIGVGGIGADGTVLAMEGLALTGASVDKDRGLLSTIVLEMGGSSDLCALLEPGEPVILMGPTGTPTETPSGETVLLAGGGLGNAVLFSIGQALRAAGSRVVYFAGYKRMIDRYKVEEIERAADIIVWCSDEAPGFVPTRAQDRAFVGNIVAAMSAYGGGKLGPVTIPLDQIDRIIAIGSDGMMGAVARARHTVLAQLLKPGHAAIGSINSPMQCMMKEICAQCLQLHKDPETGAETVVFSCFNQDQALDRVDFGNLRRRLVQNGVQEKLTQQWVDRCLKRIGRRGTLAAE
jgi:NADPH-dependent glutamate synthase beta subunit-like oxidoreductase/NAD(P)H-flavin reductase